MISDDVLWKMIEQDEQTKKVFRTKMQDAINAIDTKKVTKALDKDIINYIDQGELDWEEVLKPTVKIFGKIITNGLREHFNIPQNKRR